MKRSEHEFAEVAVDKLILESFGNDRSAYSNSVTKDELTERLEKLRGRLTWHINNSLSPRQKQVIKGYLQGRKEREMAEQLGITQQVVNIYKHRAIKKLHKILAT